MRKSRLTHILQCHSIFNTEIVRAENTHLYTKDDQVIVDFEAGIWSTVLGHSHPRINKVMIGQIQKMIHTHHSLTSEIAETLAIHLLELLGFENGKAVFLSSGSEAVQLGLRLSQLVSKGGKILTFSNSYLSAYGNTSLPRDKTLWIEIDYAQCDQCHHQTCFKQCPVLRDIDFKKISTFALESAACGRVIFPPSPLVKFLAREVQNQGGFVLANEVTTGFGRTGKWFGYSHYEITPDIVTLGKGLGNGYPISGVAMSHKIADQVEGKGFIYVQSHQNDPLGCAVASEVINILQEDQIMERSKSIGDFFMNQLKEIKKKCSIIKEVRGRGAMIGLEINVSGVTGIICEKMLEKGYFMGATPPMNLLRFFPALTISQEDILIMCKTLEDVLIELERKSLKYEEKIENE